MCNSQRPLRARWLSTSTTLCLMLVSLLISSGFATAKIIEWYAEGNPQRDMQTPIRNIQHLSYLQELFYMKNYKYARSNRELAAWFKKYYQGAPPQYLLQPHGGYYFQIYGPHYGSKWCLLAWPAFRRHGWWSDYPIPATFAYVENCPAMGCSHPTEECTCGKSWAEKMFIMLDSHYVGGYARPGLADLFVSEPFGEIDMRYWRPYRELTLGLPDIGCMERHREACDLYELKITLEKCAFASLFLSFAMLAALGLRWLVCKRQTKSVPPGG